VAHYTSCLSFFRRPGHLVLLTKSGDIVPQASHIEFCAHRLLVMAFAVICLAHHKMAVRYCPALGKVLLTQRKRLEDKRALLHEPPYITELLKLVGKHCVWAQPQ
jgi:hypothetical protein